MSTTYIEELIDIHSPSGYTEQVVTHVENRLAGLPYQITRTNKGALLVSTCPDPHIVISAHLDTLGGMVRHLLPDGTLEITQIGGWPPNSFEGEHLTVLTRSEQKYRGTFLINNPAAHVNRDVSKKKRRMEDMHVRVDAVTKNEKETRDLGIAPGDFVFFDPRFEVTATGFVKSRFLDDKACAGVMLDLLLNQTDELMSQSVAFFFSTYEEVGHGGCAGIPASAKVMLVADMGVVGNNVSGTETAVSICAKDSSGPYDFVLRNMLVTLAEQNNIPYIVDIFPYYGSDGSAALRSGMDLRVALIGPGVASSHGVERTHEQGIKATRDLILQFVTCTDLI